MKNLKEGAHLPIPVQITEATHNDVPHMAEIMSASLTEIYCDDFGQLEIPFAESSYLKNRLINRLGNSELLTLVATQGSEVVGLLAAERNSRGCRVSDIHLKPTARRAGGGRKLIQEAVNWAGPQTDLTLEFMASNTGAESFYRAMGFIPSGMFFMEIPPVQFLHQIMVKKGIG